LRGLYSGRMRPIRSCTELYAHAIAIEREAAARYAEFAQRMSDMGNAAAAEVFGTLSVLEGEHLETLLRRTEGLKIPQPRPYEYSWLDAGAPETPARELVFRLLTPHQALVIALGAERRAEAFFEEVLVSTDDPALRALAREMAADEGDHVLMLERLLERTPEEIVDWASVYAQD
jgi:rubrerythrin